jgi:hypothetical protein
VRALAASDCDLRLVDLLEIQHVVAHPSTFPFSPPRASLIPTRRSRRPPVGRLVACSVSTPGVLASRPPPVPW